MMSTSLCLVLVVLVHGNVLSVGQVTSLSGDCGELDTLYLLALAPYPDPEALDTYKPLWGGGPGIIPAARLAVELINERSDVLTNYTLALVEGDSGCNELNNKGLIKSVKETFHDGKILGVVGPACSNVAKQVGPVLGPERAAMIQVGIATSPALTDRKTYPYTFSTINSFNVYGYAIVEIAGMNQWSRVGVLYDGDSVYHQDSHQSFVEVLKCSGMGDLVEYSAGIYRNYFPLQEMKDTHLRVFIVLSSTSLARKLLCLVHHEMRSFTFPKYQWIFPEKYIGDCGQNVSFVYQQKPYLCSAQDLESIVQGAIVLQHTLVTNQPDEPMVSGHTYCEYEELYRSRVDLHEQELNISIPTELYANAYHDAVWSIALALNASIQPLSEDGLSLSDYHPGRRDISEVIVQQLTERVEFDGASGKISFDASTGHTNSSVNLLQIWQHMGNNIGAYSPGETVISNGTFIQDSFEERYVHIAMATFIVFSTITLLLLITAVIMHVLNIACYQQRSIKASSPTLNHLMFCGVYALVAVTLQVLVVGYFLTSRSTVGSVLCNSILWCDAIGRSLVLATICTKTWRIHRIFSHSWKPGSYLYNKVLLVAIFAFVVPMLTYCVIRSSVSPLQQSVEKEHRESDSMPYIEVTVGCQHRWYDILALQLYEGILLVFALCLSILTRHVRPQFKSTRSTTSLIYSLILIRCFGTTLYVLALTKDWDVNITYSIQCLAHNSTLLVCLVFGLLPPVVLLVKEKVGGFLDHVESKDFVYGSQ